MSEDLVVYFSKNGTTLETVKRIEAISKNNIDFLNLSEKVSVNLSKYKRIFIGCGIYAGTIPGQIRKFINENSSILKAKKVMFFIHGLASEKEYETIIKASLKEPQCIDGSKAFYLGGQLDIKKQNLVVKQVLKVIAKKKNLDINNMCNLNKEAINEFLKVFDR